MECDFPPEIILPVLPERRFFHDSSAAFYEALERHTVKIVKKEAPSPPKKAPQKNISVQTAPLPKEVPLANSLPPQSLNVA